MCLQKKKNKNMKNLLDAFHQKKVNTANPRHTNGKSVKTENRLSTSLQV